MAWQPNCAIAQSRATWCGLAAPVATVRLTLRGYETLRDLERWSG